MYFQSTKKKKYNAGIAIIVVISLSFIAVLGGVALSISSIDYKLATMGYSASIDLKHLAFSCQEEALEKISSDFTFTGNRSVNIEDSNCIYTVSIDSGNSAYRNVEIIVTKGDYTNRESFKVDTSTNPISLIR